MKIPLKAYYVPGAQDKSVNKTVIVTVRVEFRGVISCQILGNGASRSAFVYVPLADAAAALHIPYSLLLHSWRSLTLDTMTLCAWELFFFWPRKTPQITIYDKPQTPDS